MPKSAIRMIDSDGCRLHVRVDGPDSANMGQPKAHADLVLGFLT